MKKMIVLMYALFFLTMFSTAGIAQSVGGGDLVLTPEGAKQVLFSHEIHVNSKGLKCSGCHYHVFQMSKDSYKMDMAKITKGDFCGKCHNGQKAFDVKDEKNCSRCHK